MKKVTFLVAAFSLLVVKAHAQFVEFDSSVDPQHADIAVADINNDGRLDVVVSGRAGDDLKGAIFLNNGDGTYTLQQAENPITPGHFASIQFGDIDGDGDLDIIFNGNGGAGAVTTNGIALNDGNGVFTLAPTDRYPIPALTISCGFADFNNDGRLDYYFAGNTKPDQGPSVLIYFQQADGTFVADDNLFGEARFTDPDVTVVDFNNDGYLDLFISAWDEVGGSRYSCTWANDGFGNFSVYAQPNIIQKGYGSVAWGDVDGDGYLDMILNGDGGANGEQSDNVFRVYRNENGTMVPKQAFQDFRQISVGDGSRFVDWDNDGKLDIILGGWSATKGRQVTCLFRCTDAANFVFEEDENMSETFPGVSEDSYEVADMNNDGKPDLLITGFNGTANKNICGVFTNTSAATSVKPQVPDMLTADIQGTGDERMVIFSWNTAAGAQTYNMALRNKTTGKWLYNPMAVTEGDNNGWRKTTGLGNVCTNKKWELYELPDGVYEWTVQGVSGNYVGGPFAEWKTLTLGNGQAIESSVTEQAKVFVDGGKLVVESPAGQLAQVNVYGLNGSLVASHTDVTGCTIELPQGVYIIEVATANSVIKNKVIIF